MVKLNCGATGAAPTHPSNMIAIIDDNGSGAGGAGGLAAVGNLERYET